jgi:3-isopropylmalate/(R)-2-methylmalate dehydratase small subunit
MEAFSVVRSRTVVLPEENVDTDQIIPARFLTTTSRDGMGEHLFADRRAVGTEEPFVIDRPEAAGCEILVAGHNFACGSSREHAPWALLDFGFRAVISTGIADIFRSNALRCGLLPAVIDPDAHRRLVRAPGEEITVDLNTCTVTLPGGGETTFEIEPFARHCLLEGIDPLGFLLDKEADIRRYEENRPWTP